MAGSVQWTTGLKEAASLETRKIPWNCPNPGGKEKQLDLCSFLWESLVTFQRHDNNEMWYSETFFPCHST